MDPFAVHPKGNPMKMLSGVLAATAVLLSACGTPLPESTEGPVTPSEVRTREQALQGACYVRVECTDGSSVACSGTASNCFSAVDPSRGSYVSCNGTSTYCAMPNQESCIVRDGLPCNGDSECGYSGACIGYICWCV